MEKMKTTAPVSSVGADGVQPNVKNHNEIIANSQEQINQQATKKPEKSGNGGLYTMSMPELYDTVFVPRVPIVDGFLYGGTYLFVGAPKVGKSFFMAQLAYHVAMGIPLWDYPVRKGTVLYLALEDDYARLQSLERTISGMMGKGSINHNTRAFSAKNVDTERSIYKVEFCHAEIEEVYHELFDEALERYNAKQKRNDRKIDNYYEKIRQGKQEKLFHEAVFQIGNRDDMNAKSEEGELAKEILIEFMKDFQKRNPYLHVFSAHLHMDEETPHIHVDFVPVIHNSKRGLDTRVSLKGALGEQGFKGGTRGATEWNQWIESEKQEIAQIMGRYGIEWKQLGTHNKHLSVLDFEKQERAKEVAELEAEKESLEEQNAAILQTSEKWLGELENLEQEIHSAQENREVADKKAEVAKKEAARYEKKLAEIAPMVKDMERFAVKYSYDPEEVLLEAGTLESGKTYREKKAKPLIEKIIMVLRSVYREYLNISNRLEKLQDAYSREQDRNERLKNRLEESLEENRELRTIATDFGRVKTVMGAEQVNAVIDRARQQEQIEVEQKRAVKRKHSMEVR